LSEDLVQVKIGRANLLDRFDRKLNLEVNKIGSNT